MTAPVTRDEWGNAIAVSPLRERRLLQMADKSGFNHKRFYGQYRILIWNGLVSWSMGFAFLRPSGCDRLAELLAAGV